MPVKIPNNLPAAAILKDENVFVMDEARAYSQDIRPLRLLLLNLMPTKVVTETQFLRLLSNSPIQLDIDFLCTASYQATHTSAEYLVKFYETFDAVQDRKYDGMIVTGAPVEKMAFEKVAYWPELEEIFEWSKEHVYSTLHVCWGAQAGLYHHYGIPKRDLPEKRFGVFPHYTETETIRQIESKLFTGFDDVFYAPHSRHTENRREDIEQASGLFVLAESPAAGIFAVSNCDGRQIFLTGHAEYDPLSLKAEYDRDRAQGLPINIPDNYYPADDPSRPPVVRWRSTANLLFSNWLNYYVYQETPYDLSALSKDTLGTSRLAQTAAKAR